MLILAVLLIGGTTAAGIAVVGGGTGGGSSARAQYGHGHGPGFFCNQVGASKKHVKGMKGTPFSQCVHALKKIRRHPSLKPAKACRKLPHRHVKGMRKTPFRACVLAARRFKREHGL
jgi:hypothetical protein